MSNKNQKSLKGIAIIAGIAVVLIAVILIVNGAMGDGSSKTATGIINSNNETTKSTSTDGNSVSPNSESAETASTGGDLIIPKSGITETAKFYPYNANGTKLEVLAVKASDGTIRTAFNTCQVCNGSPRAYYKQQGDVLVCQNCGNRFRMDMVEQERGGCNPVPIMKDEKKDDGTNIVIAKDFIDKNKDMFTANWKTE